MTNPIDIVCLAKSKKYQGKCIAGIRLDTGGWVRPIADTKHHELHTTHYMTKDGHDPELLDVIQIYVTELKPESHQPENWRLSSNSWELLAKDLTERSILAINSAIERTSTIFGTTNNKIEKSNLVESNASKSLSLLVPDQVEFCRYEEGDQQRAEFLLGDEQYDLPVTDPKWEEKIKNQSFKRMPGSAYTDDDEKLLFTISLGEPYDGYCYKLIAAVFTVPSNKVLEW